MRGTFVWRHHKLIFSPHWDLDSFILRWTLAWLSRSTLVVEGKWNSVHLSLRQFWIRTHAKTTRNSQVASLTTPDVIADYHSRTIQAQRSQTSRNGQTQTKNFFHNEFSAAAAEASVPCFSSFLLQTLTQSCPEGIRRKRWPSCNQPAKLSPSPY